MSGTGGSLYSIHVSTATTWRGGENQIWLLARGLRAREQRVLVLAPPGAPLLERCAAADIPAQALGLRGELDLRGAWRLAALLRQEQPDILHLHDGHAVLAGRLAAWLVGKGRVRVIVHRRTAFEVKGRWKYGGGVDRIIAISAAVRDRLLAAGIPAGRVAVVYSGLEFPPFALASAEAETTGAPQGSGEAVALRRTLGIPESAVLVAHAAALTAEKRQCDMIAAVALANETLKATPGTGVHLALAGSGEEEESLRGEARRRGMEGRVHFLGFVADLRALWGASAVALFASEAEGLCTALIEAQGAALPAVVTRAGGMVEVVADGESGYVVEIGDTAAMAAALVKLAGDEKLRRRLGLVGARRVRAKFAMDAMVDGVLQVYRSVCSRGRGTSL
ncbi:MAG: glycosyltransferase [Planctomycetota bacterium]|nr:glycosyltransferase [Planctomycetota bacterium]